MKRSCWLHVHVPKAGGSTLRQLMNRNFGKGYYNSTSLLETKQYSRDDVSEIIRCHPWVTCMSDHKLSLDLPYDHPDADVFGLAFVREPVERFISRYFFHRHFEEVQCLAQRLSFRDFANAELVEHWAHPQTNSQIYFLSGGKSATDLDSIRLMLDTRRAYLFPIERFDEACSALEYRFPQYFPDLSYVRANVSNKDLEIAESDRQWVSDLLALDQPVYELAHRQLDLFLTLTFPTQHDASLALEDFQERCSRRFHNFHAPHPKPTVEASEAVTTPHVSGS